MAVPDEAGLAPPGKKSDLGVRTLSAVVMVLVAGTALWLGGYAWIAFVALVTFGVLWEWEGLVRAITFKWWSRLICVLAGAIYVGIAAVTLLILRLFPLLTVIGFELVLAVIATDIGAYFAGRTFGGPKIAPRISPSKTWAGLAGGILGASLVPLGSLYWQVGWQSEKMAGKTGSMFAGPVLPIHWGVAIGQSLIIGALIAVIAQTGDFFESWMKRRAGVKDSGSLIPGHGGLFDRVDGLLAVLFVTGIAAGMVKLL